MNEIRALAAAVPSVIDGLSLLVSHPLAEANRSSRSRLSPPFPPFLETSLTGRGHSWPQVVWLCRILCYTPAAAGVALPCSRVLKLSCVSAQVTAGSQTTYAWVRRVIFTTEWCNGWLTTSNTNLTQMLNGHNFFSIVFIFFIYFYKLFISVCLFVSWNLIKSLFSLLFFEFLWITFALTAAVYDKKRVLQEKTEG